MLLGSAKADITAFKEGVGMLGYGVNFNIMQSVSTPLYARAFIFKDSVSNNKIALVNCELAFITPSLKKGVVKKLNRKYPQLNYSNQNLLISAQHTHSGPGGFSHHGLYNMNSPGFVIDIYNIIVNGIVEAIVNAEKKLEDVDIYLAKSEFSPDKEVGFQRSIKAYLQNPEAKKITKEQLHLGINREMTLLKFISKNNLSLKGIMNWFGTHPTNLANTNTSVCSDNKGFAAQYLEDEFKKQDKDFIGIFAQGSCGDVTPKFKFNPKNSAQRGKWDGKFLNDDLKSAQYNGKLQYEKAAEIIHQKDATKITSNDIDFGLKYVNFANLEVNPKFTNGIEGVKTSPSCMGVAFMEGSKIDGPGMLQPLTFFAEQLSNLVKIWEYIKSPFMPKEWSLAMRQKYTAQGNKKIAIESGARKIMGTYDINNLIIPAITDELISNLKKFHRRGALDKNPWTPQILPLQIIKIGSIALCAFPFEITTIASQRLQKSLEDILIGSQYSHVILCPYSNAYNGYITTYEEYQVQEYEGGHTVFGEWSLAALQSEFETLAIEMLKPKENRSLNNDINPIIFNDDDIKKFKHFTGRYYINTLKKKEKIQKKKNKLEKRIEKIETKIKKLG